MNVDDIRMNNSGDGHEIWFTNKDGEQILAARYEDADLIQMAIGERKGSVVGSQVLSHRYLYSDASEKAFKFTG